MSEADIEVTAAIRLQRDALREGLREGKTEIQQWAQEVRGLAIELPVKVDLTNARAELARFRAEAAANPITIPVQLGVPGGMPGGGDWRDSLNQIRQQQIAQSAGGIRQQYADYLTAARVSGPRSVSPYEVNDYSGGGEFALGPIHDRPSRYSMGESGAEEAAEAGGRGKRGRFSMMADRMFTRLILYEAVRAPIQHAAAEFEAWDKFGDAQSSGSVSDSRKALLEALRADSGGLIGHALNPGEADLANQMVADEGAERRGAMALSASQRAAVLGLDIEGLNAGPGAERRRLEREARHTAAVNEAQGRQRRASDEFNRSGAAQAVEAAHRQQEIHIYQDYSTEGPESLAQFNARRAALAANDVDYQSKLGQLRRQFGVTDSETQAAIRKADAERDAAAREDAASESIRDIRSRGSVAHAGESAKNALMGFTGSGIDARLGVEKSQMGNRVTEMREIAKATQDAAEAQRKLNEAVAQENANPALLEARKYAMESQSAAAVGTLQGMNAANREASARLSGNTVEATTVRAQSEEMNRKAELGKMREGGLIGDDQYMRGMRLADRATTLAVGEAEKSDIIRTGRMEAEIGQLGIASPFARQLQRVRDEARIGAFADPSHADLLTRRASAEEDDLRRRHDLDVAAIAGSAADIRLAGGHQYGALVDRRPNRYSSPGSMLAGVHFGPAMPSPLTAAALAHNRQLRDLLAQNEGDPEKQNAIRERAAAEAQAMSDKLRPEALAGNEDARRAMAGYDQERQNALRPFGGHGDAHGGAGAGAGGGKFDQTVDKFGQLIDKALANQWGLISYTGG